MSQHLEIPGYDILELIGEGGMAHVYKARQKSLNRIVAVKVLRRELTTDPAALAQFQLEANSVATLKHPNILMIHEAGRAGGLPYFIMEYVSAYSVYAWITRKGALSLDDALTVAGSVASALKYAWEKAGLVHADLKPGNILVDEDGTVKVADFSGLSRSNLSQEAKLIKSLTIGTPNFMAPEQAGGFAELDFRSDVYSLGALLYQLLTGVMPFAQCTAAEAMRMQMEGTLEDPLKLNPSLSPAAAMLLEKLMVKDRDHRYSSWDAVVTDIRRVRGGSPPAPPMPFPGSSTAPRSQLPPASAGPKTSAPVFAPYVSAAARVHHTRHERLTSRISLLVVLGFSSVLFVLGLLYIWSRHPSNAERPLEPLPVNPPTPAAPAPPTAPRPPTEPAPVTPVITPAPGTDPSVVPPRTPPEPEPGLPEEPNVDEPEEPVSPPAELPPSDTRTLDDLRAHITLVEELKRLCRDLDMARAMSRAAAWSARHPEGSPWNAQAAAELERMTRLSALQQRVFSSGKAAAGQTLTSGEKDVIQSIDQGRVSVVRRLSAGTAVMEIGWNQLRPEDQLAVIGAVDPGRSGLNQAIWKFAVLGQPVRIESDTEDSRWMARWISDWSRAHQNREADQAVEMIRGYVLESRHREAIETARVVETRYAATDILEWARTSELTKLLNTANEELNAASVPVAPITPSPAPVNPRRRPLQDTKQNAVRTLTPLEIMEDWRKLDSPVIQLKYRYREPIKAVSGQGADRYTTKLGYLEDRITVLMDVEGERIMRRVPESRVQAGATDRWVYGRVESDGTIVRLLGSRPSPDDGEEGHDYRW
ncbi:MAG: serine/threonine protein kinase [Kiritimatiellae bacterium]|nr:serine/threonine protein kinase [Kiritimatiellia bacterium]